MFYEFHDFSEVDMSRHQMIHYVDDQIENGVERIDAIRKLALYLDEDDPINPEVWFQSKIGGE
jgi:hypothetical protein